MKLIDRTGLRYGRLIVLKRVEDKIHPSGKRTVMWECKCDCGNVVRVSTNGLRKGTKSCGCFHNEETARIHFKHGHSRKGNRSRLYRIWQNMKERCNSKNFKYYGGRGITYSKEWEEFESFKEWSYKNGYNDSLSIDRIDTNGNYEPSNCRWVDMQTQQNNRRSNRVLLFDGKNKTVADWARETGIPKEVIYGRLRRNWSIEKTLTTPKRKMKKKSEWRVNHDNL